MRSLSTATRPQTLSDFLRSPRVLISRSPKAKQLLSMENHLVWFRNDLRIHDHPALSKACSNAERDGGNVACVYVIDPHWFGKTRFGFDRIGPPRRRFLLESLIDLRSNLKQLGGTLHVVRGKTSQQVPRVAKVFRAGQVYCNQEFGTEELEIQRQTETALQQQSVVLSVSTANTLLREDDLPFTIEQLPEVFSKFRRKVEKTSPFRSPRPSVDSVPAASVNGRPISVEESVELESTPEFYGASSYQADPRGVMEFRGGETAGLARINDYFFESDRLSEYKETRNGMLGEGYSSKLSPWLAFGCLSPRYVTAEVRRYEEERVANDSTNWLIFELLWRDYFAFILAKHGAKLFRVGGLRELSLPWQHDEDRFEVWRLGQTGFPLIDANMRELAATGFMSNRGRQNVASFLTKNLGLDWRLGAEWFESQLIDYDPASNYGNWNYTAGIGNDARGFRWFNTMKQAQNYDPDGNYVRHWIEELSGVPKNFIHSPWQMHSSEQSRSGCLIGQDYPKPIVDLFRSADANQEIYDRA